MTRTEHYPEHDRTSCSDANPCNAEAGGSCGCARCTAILLDQRDELQEQTQALAGLLKRCARCLPPEHKTRKLASDYLRQHGFMLPLRTSGVAPSAPPSCKNYGSPGGSCPSHPFCGCFPSGDHRG